MARCVVTCKRPIIVPLGLMILLLFCCVTGHQDNLLLSLIMSIRNQLMIEDGELTSLIFLLSLALSIILALRAKALEQLF